MNRIYSQRVTENENGEMAAEPAPASGMSLLPDPGLMWQIFRRNLWLFVATVGLVLGAVAAYALTRQPLFSATASLLIQPANQPVRTLQLSQPEHASVASDAIDTSIRLIASPFIANRAARAYSRTHPWPGGGEWTPEALKELAETMLSSLEVSRDGATLVLDIRSVGADPQFVSDTANLFAAQFLYAQVDSKSAEAKGADDFLRARLGQLEEATIRAQGAVDNYKAARGLMSAQGATIAEQEVSTLNQQLAQAKAELAEKRGRLNAARAQLTQGGGGADVGAALGSSTIASLRQRESEASARLASMNERYGQLHPERRQVEGELADIRLGIQGEINRILSSLEAEVRTAESRVGSLSGSRGVAAGTLANNGRAQASLGELEQRAAAARAVYENFLARSRESTVLISGQLPDGKIAVVAEPPTAPFFPNFKLLGLFAIIGATAAGIGAVAAGEYLRRGIMTKRDVERRLGVRYAGAIPTLKSALHKRRRPRETPHDYIVSHPQSLFAESFRSVRTFLLLSAGSTPHSIAITSALPREGKTTTSVCLARATALAGFRTMLVDSDLRRRGASELLGIRPGPDLQSYLRGEATLQQAIHVDEASGLHLLGTTDILRDATDPLTEQSIRVLLDELRADYDLVILDTAPVLGVAEARLIARLADRVLVVTRWKHTSVRAVEAVIDNLINAQAKVSGLALTQVDIRSYASTGDGDVYGYTKMFRGYYQD
ncbi:MAG: etk 1 [Sphingomonas bacterium]|nr:etk 1 [Sphingomonas bacterium]